MCSFSFLLATTQNFTAEKSHSPSVFCMTNSWSSTRQPHEVFVLLETLYGEFDSIARRRRVSYLFSLQDLKQVTCLLLT